MRRQNLKFIALFGLLLLTIGAAQAQKLKLVVQSGHSDGVSQLAVSPQGEMMASASFKENSILLWNTRTGEQITALDGHAEGVSEIAFSADGKMLASGGYGKTIKLWNVQTGEEIRTIEPGGFVQALALSSDGKFLFSVHSVSVRVTITIWSLPDAQLIESVELATKLPRAELVLSVDNKFLALAVETEKPEIIVLDAVTLQQIKTLETFSAPVFSLNFSPDGKSIVSGDRNGETKLWDFASGREIKRFTEHAKWVYAVVFSPDGKTFMTAGADGTIKMWDAGGNRLIAAATVDGKEGVLQLEYAPDGKSFFSGNGDGSIIRWDSATLKKLQTFGSRVASVKATDIRFDGKRLASNSENSEDIKIWDLEKGRLEKNIVGGETIGSVAFSPDGRLLAVTDVKRTKMIDAASGVELWSSAQFVPVWVTFSPDSKRLISSSMINKKILDAESGREVRLVKSSGFRGMISFDEKSKMVALAEGDTISIIDLATGQTVQTLYDETSEWGILSPDGKFLAGTNLKKESRYWDVASGREMKFAQAPAWVKFPQQSFTPNDYLARKNTVKMDGAKIQIFDAAGKREIATLVALNENDWAVVAPDGRFDASEGALELMHYSYGLETIGLEQLKEAYYEPGLLSKLLSFSREPLRPIVPLKDVKLYPEIFEQKFDEARGKLEIKLKNRGGGIGKTEVYVNDKIAIEDARSEKLKRNPNIALGETVALTVELPPSSLVKGRENKIRIVTSNYLKEIGKGNIQSRGVEIIHFNKGREEYALPTLYAVVGGVSDYSGDALDLRFAAKDAEDFSNALSLGARRLFCAKENPNCLDKVNIQTLSTSREKPEEQPTKENFQKAFADIAAKAKPEDIVVIYLAGHGVSFGTGTDTYFYLTKEARSASREDLTKTFQTTAISSEELTDWLTQKEWVSGQKGIKPLKQVLILDTCASGNAAEKLTLSTKRDLSGDQIRAIEFLKDKTGTFVLMGSTADAPSYEASQYGQGLLTYSLLQAMKGAALDKGEYIDVQQLFAYAQREVPRLAENIGGVQRPIVSAPLGKTFVIGQMTDTDKSNLKLPMPKPLLLRPLLTNPETGDDDLKMIPALRKMLDAESSYEVARRGGKGEPVLIYVDDDSFPGAVRVTGTYTIEGEKVRVKAFLRQDGKTVAPLAEIFTTKEKVLEELLNAVRGALPKAKVH